MLDATRLRVLVAVARHGSVTAAAQALNYAQPSISHHMARLEAETGTKLIERAGRGIRLTEAGRLLAERAEEILGRIDSAEAELAAYVGLRPDRVRLAGFGSALGTLVTTAAAALRQERPGTEIYLTQAEPAEALRMLRAGEVDVALIFRYITGDADGAAHPADLGPRGAEELHCEVVLDEAVYLITPCAPADGDSAGQAQPPGAADAGQPTLTDYMAGHWIGGCERCADFLASLCQSAGFAPDVIVRTDDYVAVQALVAARLGVATLPSLALEAVRHPGIRATELAGARRQVVAVTYPRAADPPACGQLIEALTRAGRKSGEHGSPRKRPPSSN